jgi:hypothetical protein
MPQSVTLLLKPVVLHMNPLFWHDQIYILVFRSAILREMTETKFMICISFHECLTAGLKLQLTTEDIPTQILGTE